MTMSCQATGIEKGGPSRAGRLGAADWLSLAAAPTFAVMALVTAAGGPGPLDMLCSGASPLGSMAAMYGLMSAFHAAPWLRLIPRAARQRLPALAMQRRRVRRPGRVALEQ